MTKALGLSLGTLNLKVLTGPHQPAEGKFRISSVEGGSYMTFNDEPFFFFYASLCSVMYQAVLGLGGCVGVGDVGPNFYLP